MKKAALLLVVTSIMAILFLNGCERGGKNNGKDLLPDQTGTNVTDQVTENTENQGDEVETTPTTHTPTESQKDNTSDNLPEGTTEDEGGNGNPSAPEVDLEKIKPNEAGKIMVVMFHNFVETPVPGGDREYTTTLAAFENLLEELYAKGYRLIGMSDYLNNNISVPAGCIPMIFTFDDGTAGQFHLVSENGRLVANRKTAVGIMEEFNKKHPDFGLKGTFYVNLGSNTFPGEGTVSERLQYLIDKGFEIGNHTYTHTTLDKTTDAESIQKVIGENQKKLHELIPGYQMISFSLPKGIHPKESLKEYVARGEYQGTAYEHQSIVLVGAEPALSPVHINHNPLMLRRVRASGLEPVKMDLAWWLEKLTREQQYISDGDPDTISVPKNKEQEVDVEKLRGKKLRVY